MQSLRKPPRESAHWLVKELDELLLAHGLGRNKLLRETGLNPKTLANWYRGKGKRSPCISSLEACLKVLGKRLQVVDEADGSYGAGPTMPNGHGGASPQGPTGRGRAVGLSRDSCTNPATPAGSICPRGKSDSSAR